MILIGARREAEPAIAEPDTNRTNATTVVKSIDESNPSDPGAAEKGFYWNSLPFGELLWVLMGILIRIHKNSPNSTEFQPAENG